MNRVEDIILMTSYKLGRKHLYSRQRNVALYWSSTSTMAHILAAKHMSAVTCISFLVAISINDALVTTAEHFGQRLNYQKEQYRPTQFSF